MIDIQPYGDTALLVSFEQKISRETHAQVMLLQQRLSGYPGIRYMIPAFCSLTIVYNTAIYTAKTLEEVVQRFSAGLAGAPSAFTGRLIEVPVCYDPGMALDMEEVIQQTGKSAQEIVEAHTRTEFYVYMLGFVPGFAYMGDLAPEYHCRRRATPRVRVPAGSVGIAGLQTAVYPFESPGGWQIIGRTPMPVFDASLDSPCVFQPGDHVRFTAIDPETFRELSSTQ